MAQALMLEAQLLSYELRQVAGLLFLEREVAEPPLQLV
jgi:hypothetical protein